MANPYLGMIKMFAGNFAPRGWMFCSGQLLAIAEYDALYALIGTTYGGDGQVTMGLPDLRGRVPVSQGTGAGATFVVGQSTGSEQVTLNVANAPAHSHALMAQSARATSRDPQGRVLGQPGVEIYTSGVSRPISLNTAAISPVGGNQPHDNMAPFLCVNFIIAVEGIFPSRN